MSKLDRKTQKIFADALPADDNIAIFGSLADEFAASPPEGEGSGNDVEKEMYSKDPDKIQSDAYDKGWADAVVPDDSPALEDMNALFYLVTRQLAYVYQNGVPEWDAGTTYCIGSICSQSGVLYISLADDNTNNAVSNAAKWKRLDKDITDAIALKEDRANKKQLVNPASQTDFPSSAAVAAHVAAQIASALSTAFVREFPDITGIGVQVAATPSLPGAEGNTCFTLSWDSTATQWIIAYWTFSGGAWLPVETTPARDLHWVAVQSGAEINGYYVMSVTDSQGSPPQWELLGPDISDIYTKGETDSLLAVKADGAALAATDAKADQALGTANDALGDANTAQQTADLATDAANAAQNTANSAQQTASSALQALAGKADLVAGKVPLSELPDITALPAGGTTGQILTKKSDADGDADWENPAAPAGGIVKVADTWFVDDKFGDDSTGLTERLDKPFKTLEAPLGLIAELGSEPASIIIDNWSFEDQSTSMQTADGRWFIRLGEYSIIWTNGDDCHYLNSLSLSPAGGYTHSGVQIANVDANGNIYIYNSSLNTFQAGDFSVPVFHGIIYNSSAKAYVNTDWMAPAWVGGSIPAPGRAPGSNGTNSRARLFPNGNLAYSHPGGTTIITPDSQLLVTTTKGGDSINNTAISQMRVCTNSLMPPYIISKYNTILTQDGKVFDSNMGGTHWAYNDTYIVQSKEGQTTSVILPRSFVDTPSGTGELGSVNGFQFNWGSWIGNTIRCYKNRFYGSSNPMKTLDVTAVDGTGKPTAISISNAIDVDGNPFATGGNHQVVPIKGGLVSATQMFFSVDPDMRDVGVLKAILDVGARQDMWTPATPTTSSGGVLKFWPSRISIRGHGHNTRVDLSSFVDGIDVEGSNTWLLSYNPSHPKNVKLCNVRDAYVDTMAIAVGNLIRCKIEYLYENGTLSFVYPSIANCIIGSLDSTAGIFTRCAINVLNSDNGATFLGCDIFGVIDPTMSIASGTYKGCRLPVGFMAANNGTYENCVEIY
jgi:hypothetical protein